MHVTIRPLIDSDVQAVAALYSSNSRESLSANERARQGFVQGAMSPERLRAMLDGPCALVADSGGTIAGALLTHPFSSGLAGPPALAEQVALEAGVTNAVHYGPVVVGKDFRQQGLSRRLGETAFETLTGRFETAVAFMELENTTSVAVHQKLGWTSIGTFTWQDRPYQVATHVITTAPVRSR